ncbi:unnamed protein product [Rotaria magnacalcarata]
MAKDRLAKVILANFGLLFSDSIPCDYGAVPVIFPNGYGGGNSAEHSANKKLNRFSPYLFIRDRFDSKFKFRDSSLLEQY